MKLLPVVIALAALAAVAAHGAGGGRAPAAHANDPDEKRALARTFFDYHEIEVNACLKSAGATEPDCLKRVCLEKMPWHDTDYCAKLAAVHMTTPEQGKPLRGKRKKRGQNGKQKRMGDDEGEYEYEYEYELDCDDEHGDDEHGEHGEHGKGGKGGRMLRGLRRLLRRLKGGKGGNGGGKDGKGSRGCGRKGPSALVIVMVVVAAGAALVAGAVIGYRCVKKRKRTLPTPTVLGEVVLHRHAHQHGVTMMPVQQQQQQQWQQQRQQQQQPQQQQPAQVQSPGFGARGFVDPSRRKEMLEAQSLQEMSHGAPSTGPAGPASQASVFLQPGVLLAPTSSI